MVVLVASISTVYDLPYFLLGPFRPTALEAFGLTNTESGIALAVYGFVNLVLYAPGGPIADHFSPGLNMSIGLLLTGAGGFYMATFPPFPCLCLLLFVWSISSIMMYWAAFVKAVRMWGKPEDQAWSWCVLGALSATASAFKLVLIVFYFSSLLPNGAEHASLVEKRHAIQRVIHIYSIFTCFAAVLVVISFPIRTYSSEQELSGGTECHDAVSASRADRFRAIATLKVALMASVLMAAYFCNTLTNYFPQFAVNGYRTTAVDAAWIVTLGAWAKPFVCLAVGSVALRARSSGVCAASLFCFLVVFTLMGINNPKAGRVWELIILVVLGTAAQAAVGSVFFAMLQEADIPSRVTGTVVGFVSIVGYSPDLFSPPLLGYIMDRHPGFAGNQYTMLVGAAFALFGLIAALFLVTLLRSTCEADAAKTKSEETPLIAKAA